MEIYTNTDIKLLEQNIDEIHDKIQNIKYEIFDPTKTEMDQILNIVLDYVKKKKRKIYGGTAHNEIIKNINKEDSFYKNSDIPDIDIYSYEPIIDIMKVANILAEKGFVDIEGREAQHKDTYSLFVKRVNYLDVSYVPKNIYNRMPYIEINKLYYIHPTFAMIDFYRMLNDPLTSFFRIEKSFKRLILLQKYFPIQKIKKPILYSFETNETHQEALNLVFDFLKENTDNIILGEYSYNHFVKTSEINAPYIKELEITRYDFISANYINDGKKLIKMLREKYKDKIKVKEYYPFFQFFGFNATITLNDIPIARIYHHNNKCLAYITKNKLKLASFNLLVLFYLIHYIYARTNKIKNKMENMDIFISHLFQMRNYFLKKNNKTIFDKTPFEEFIIECIGETIEPMMEFNKRVKLRKSKGKPLIWSYKPTKDNIKEPDQTYIFSNYSGNPINNPKNLKLA
jgi:hypothetical protein